MLTIDTASPTFDRTVNVRFAQPGGSFKTGSFKATFKRVSKDRIDEFVDPDKAYSVNDVLEEVLVGVSGIGRKTDAGPAEELPPAEQLAWVRSSAECCSAVFNDFFAAMRQDAGAEKTSRKPR